jgi:hypothetical protein
VISWTKDDNTIDEERVSWLALAWDRQVQVAKYVKSKMIKHKEWKLDSAAIGVAWLNDQAYKTLHFWLFILFMFSSQCKIKILFFSHSDVSCP